MKLLRAAFVFSFAAMCGLAACVADDPTTGSGDDTSGNDASIDGGIGNDGGPGSDGSTGDSAPHIDAGPKNFCATQTAPAGAADFFCADFDEADFESGFTDGGMTDGAVLTTTTLAAFSAPSSLNVQVDDAVGDSQYTVFQWQKTAAQSLAQITVSAEINSKKMVAGASEDGFVLLMGIQLTQYDIDFGYTTGSTTFDGSVYSGYAVHVRHVGVFGSTDVIELPYLTDETWTNVAISLDLGTGVVSIAYAGTTVGSKSEFTATETLATALVGGYTYGDTLGGNWRIDNFEVVTHRSP